MSRNKLSFFSALVIFLVLILAAQAAKAEKARVAYVLDGDTIVLSDGRHVRYIGVNAPEIAHENRPAQPFSKAAAAFNHDRVANTMVTLETDHEKFDHYGRTLAYVFLKDGTFVNESMVRQGLAFCLSFPKSSRFENRLLAAQRQAMADGLGLWQNWKESSSGGYWGNKHSRRFHAPDCRHGSAMSKKNRVWFGSMWDAFEQGYAPCAECLGDWMTVVKKGGQKAPLQGRLYSSFAAFAASMILVAIWAGTSS